MPQKPKAFSLPQQKMAVELVIKSAAENMRTMRVPEAQRDLILEQARAAVRTLTWLSLHDEEIKIALGVVSPGPRPNEGGESA